MCMTWTIFEHIKCDLNIYFCYNSGHRIKTRQIKRFAYFEKLLEARHVFCLFFWFCCCVSLALESLGICVYSRNSHCRTLFGLIVVRMERFSGEHSSKWGAEHLTEPWSERKLPILVTLRNVSLAKVEVTIFRFVNELFGKPPAGTKSNIQSINSPNGTTHKRRVQRRAANETHTRSPTLSFFGILKTTELLSSIDFMPTASHLPTFTHHTPRDSPVERPLERCCRSKSIHICI